MYLKLVEKWEKKTQTPQSEIVPRKDVSMSLQWKSCRFEVCIEISTFSSDKKLHLIK